MKEAPSTTPSSRGSHASGEGEPTARYFADAPNRLVAYVIDALVLTILVFVGAIVISITWGPVVTIDLEADPIVHVDTSLALMDLALALAINAVYFVGTWIRLGGSPGQRMLALSVSTPGERGVSFRQAAVRWLFIGLPLGLEGLASVALQGSADAAIAALVAIWYAALLVSIARHPMKQGWHDRVANTVVTKRAIPAPAERASHPLDVHVH